MSAFPSLLSYFDHVPDPRCGNAKRHELVAILLIALCAVLCGADSWVEIEEYGRSKRDWLAVWLPLPHGIPSHDTFARVFARLKPDALTTCFLSLLRALAPPQKQTIAMDGKQVRAARAGEAEALHMVSAWACQQRLVLGQVKVDAKSNEITAVPQLLAMLEVAGCVVTLDALNTQKAIAAQIVGQEGDYVLALKENHPTLLADVKGYFEHQQKQRFENCAHTRYESTTFGHGRQETRRCDLLTLAQDDPLWRDVQQEWVGLRSFARLARTRRQGDKVEEDVHYYLCSLSTNARQVALAVRQHWGIENRLHWVLDVAFQEDTCRIRKDHAGENLVILRHLALNLLRQEKTLKTGIKVKRSKAGWDNDYLRKVLTI